MLGETKRADFVTLTPDDQRIACDIMVTASPTPWEGHGDHLLTSAGVKATRYHECRWVHPRQSPAGPSRPRCSHSLADVRGPLHPPRLICA